VIEIVAATIIAFAALYLMVLAAASFFAPARATLFLNGFAGSARAHVTEMLIRITVGCSLIVHAPHMLFPTIFLLAGWVLVLSSVVLLLLPWRWHQRFAQKVVPPITGQVRLFGIACLALGCMILFALL
jgi:uncharacterized protein YjeT (DUF2065 family)